MVALSTFAVLCIHHLGLVPECFITPDGNPMPTSGHTQPPSPASLWHPLISFPSLWICHSHEWRPAVRARLCLASLTQPRVSEVYPCCSVWSSFLFTAELCCTSRRDPILLISSFVRRRSWGCFHLWALVSRAARNICVGLHVFLTTRETLRLSCWQQYHLPPPTPPTRH